MTEANANEDEILTLEEPPVRLNASPADSPVSSQSSIEEISTAQDLPSRPGLFVSRLPLGIPDGQVSTEPRGLLIFSRAGAPIPTRIPNELPTAAQVFYTHSVGEAHFYTVILENGDVLFCAEYTTN